MFGQSIQLIKAANGFIVILPYSEPLYSPGPDYTSPEVIRKQVRIMKEEMEKDPLLSKLQSDIEEEHFEQIPPKPKNNIYIFKTYNEVTDFLRDEFYSE